MTYPAIYSNKAVSKAVLFMMAAVVAIGVGSRNAVAAETATGKATIYSNSFNGKKTATGAIYKSHELSAASNRLPLGSKVLVKNKKTGKNVVLKVNDRMSKHSTAAVDVSPAAASKLGIKGIAPVEATVVGK